MTTHPLTAALAVDHPPTEPSARTLLGVPGTHGAPHHDVAAIKPGDYVMQVERDRYIRAGAAHHQNEDGDWFDKDGWMVLWAEDCPVRPDAVTVWPAPTPTAEEVALPTEHPAHLTNVEDVGGDVCAYMALDRTGLWSGVDQDGYVLAWRPSSIAYATLPDGTWVRRDGEHSDGTPRFVKVQEEEK